MDRNWGIEREEKEKQEKNYEGKYVGEILRGKLNYVESDSAVRGEDRREELKFAFWNVTGMAGILKRSRKMLWS